MTYIGDKVHPRKPSWLWLLCDDCGENFWSPDWPKEGRHYCADCQRPGIKHPTDGRSRNWSGADAQYHGDAAGGSGDRA